MKNHYEIERDGLKCTLKVVVPKEAVSHAYASEMNKARQQGRIKGYRKGKMKEQDLRRVYGRYIDEKILQDFHEKGFEEGLKEHQVSVAGDVDLQAAELQNGQPYTFSIAFESMPEVDLAALKKIKLKRATCQIDDAQVQAELARLLGDHPSYESVKRKSKAKDQVVMDFKGMIDGEAFDNGTAEDFEYVIGSARLLPEFDKSLPGVVKDEVLTIDVAFPDNYHAEELSGKKAQFEVKIKDVRAPKKAKVDQDFFSKVGSQAKDEEAYKKELSERLNAEASEMTRSDLVEKMKSALVKPYKKLTLPECMIKPEETRLTEQKADDAVEKAKENVLASIIYQSVMKEHNLQVNEKDLRDFVGKMSMPYMEKDQFIQWYLSDEQRARQAAGLALEEKIVDHILGMINYDDNEVSFDQLKKLNTEK